jgi:hypothetical protein
LLVISETICETDNIRLNLGSLKPLYKGQIMPSTTIARGNSLSTFYIAPSLTPTSVTTLTTGAQTFTIPGLLTTDIVNTLGVVGNQTAGITIVESDVSSAGVLTIQFGNFTAGTLTPAAGVYYIEVIRPEGPLPVTAV